MKAKKAERDSARHIASWIRRAHDFWRRAANAAAGSRQEQAALTSAADYHHLVGMHICKSGSPRFLLLLADELKGKPIEIYRAGWYDDIIREAMEEAVTLRKVDGHLDIRFDYPFADLHKELKVAWERKKLPSHLFPQYRSLYRAAKRCGYKPKKKVPLKKIATTRKTRRRGKVLSPR